MLKIVITILITIFFVYLHYHNLVSNNTEFSCEAK